MNEAPAARSSRGLYAFYLLTLIAGVGIFWLVREYGEGLPTRASLEVTTTAENHVPKPTIPKIPVLGHVLLTLTAVVFVGLILGRCCRWIGQPAVIGEIIAGLLLGPSLLGMISPEAMHWLIPSVNDDPTGKVRSALYVIAQIGIISYMFMVGTELNLSQLKHEASSAIAISHAGIIFPFVSGVALSLLLYPAYAEGEVSFTKFALFIGMAMSITAFPVLAKILQARQMTQTKPGMIALGCAATDDATAWCLMAFVVGIAKSQLDAAIITAVCTIIYILGMLLVIKPIIEKLVRQWDQSTQEIPAFAFPAVIVAMLLSALITEKIGIHAIFGGFVMGAMIPQDSRLAKMCRARMEDTVNILLLPAFFALMGMSTQVGSINDLYGWLLLGVILLTAIMGKFGGTVIAARVAGIDWRTSTALGALMNTRGLMGIIALDIGRQMNIISEKLFTMMLLMAIITTMLTAPVLSWLYPKEPPQPLTAT